jgi:ribosomal protein S18 acetylase RimI-like enzyme
MIVPNKNSIDTWSDSEMVTIRQMTNDDIVPYCTLFQTVFAKEPWNEVWTIPQIQKIITRQMKNNGFTGMAAVTNDATLGYVTGYKIWSIPSIFYLDQLFVKPDFQGLKIGKKLLAEAERFLKKNGLSHIFLFTKPHSYAQNFYIKNTYTPFVQSIRIKGKSIFYKHL